MKKTIIITESQLMQFINKIVKESKEKTIKEQPLKKKTEIKPKNLITSVSQIVVTRGSNSQAKIVMHNNKKLMVIETESGQIQSMYVNTTLPVGDFLFELTEDGKMMGVGPKHKLIPITPAK